MIGRADVEKLRSMRASESAVLSMYLPVPLDPAAVRGLAAEAGDLMVGVGTGGPAGASTAGVSDADRDAVLGVLAAHGRDWLGHTVAFFACRELGLFEALPLPGVRLPERAVLATRPHVRPLLAALQRCPDYRVAIADRRHAWVLSVSGNRAETVARRADQGPRSPGFGGWYGLETHRVQQRIIQLGRHHYRETAAILQQADAGRNVPLVIGGHHDGIAGLLQALPPVVREAFAGSFTADPNTLTPARIRELASPVIDSWLTRRERELAEEILGRAPGRLAAVGLPASLIAVNEGAVAHLLVAHEGLIPGFVCGHCGALCADSDECPDWAGAAWPVPDLVEEMVQRTLDDDGQVTVIRDAPFSTAAELRFPVTTEAGGWPA